METRAIELVQRLAAQELAIANVYQVFTESLPDMQEFWGRLVEEEKAHADVVTRLLDFSDTDGVRVNTRLFHLEAINTNITYLTQLQERVQRDAVTPVQALSLAADIENGLIDKQYFRIIESKDPDVCKELEALETHTLGHIVRVQRRLQQEQSQSLAQNVAAAQRSKLRQLAKTEELIADLYQIYQETVPELHTFWKNLSTCERRHAALIDSMQDLVTPQMQASLKNIKPESIDIFISLVSDAIATAQSTPITAHQSLIAALTVESSLFDSNFYTVNPSEPDSEAALISETLTKETREHMDALQSQLRIFTAPKTTEVQSSS